MMGMRSNKTQGYVSGGTSSYPVTGFPASAYLGNNRRVGSQQTQPSPMAGGIGSVLQFNPQHSLITIVVIIALGAWLWYMDNR